jgi:hypothetical protein
LLIFIILIEEIVKTWRLAAPGFDSEEHLGIGTERIRLQNLSRRMAHMLEVKQFQTDIADEFDENAVASQSNEASEETTDSYRIFERKEGVLGKGTLCMEYSDLGTGDFRTAGFSVKCADGSTITPLRYVKHAIYKGKMARTDPMSCPTIGRTATLENEASTLVITMADFSSGLEVDLIYVSMHNYNVITRKVVFRNKEYSSTRKSALGPKTITCAHSVLVDFESTSHDFYLVQLSGSWCREGNVIETKLTHGMQSFSSSRGVSSHQHNPFAGMISLTRHLNHFSE